MPTNFQQLYRHDRWANRLILAACADLTPEQLAADCVGTHGALRLRCGVAQFDDVRLRR